MIQPPRLLVKNPYLSWFAFLYPFMFEMPALRSEFEQLCECLREACSAELGECPVDADPRFFLKVENSFCHLEGCCCCICNSKVGIKSINCEYQKHILESNQVQSVHAKIKSFI